MNAIFNTSKSATVSRTLVLAICLAIAALGLAIVPTHKALAATAPSGFTTQVYKDTDHNGTVDTLVVTFNGDLPFTTCTFNALDWTYVGNGIGGSISGGSCVLATGVMTLTITGANANTTGATSAPTIAFANGGRNDIGNATGFLAGTVSATALTDNANPILLSVVKSVASNSNTLTFTYSENMTVANGASSAAKGDTTTAGTVAGFGSFATAGNVTVATTKNTVGGNGTAALTVVLASQSGGYLIAPSTTEPSGVFTPVASAAVADAAANQVSTTPTPTASGSFNLVKPTITSITLKDAAGNNGKLDQAVIVFSTSILDASMPDGNGLLGGGGHTGTYLNGTGGDTANDNTRTFNLTADTLAVDTSISTIKFNSSGFITDLAGNLIATTTPGSIVDGDNTGKLVDGAKPIVVSVTVNKTASRNNLTIVYSEPVTLTCAAGVSTATCGDLAIPGSVETLAGFGTFATGNAAVFSTKNTIAGSGTATIAVTLADVVGGWFYNGSTVSPSGVFTPVAAAAVTDAASNQVNTSAAAPTTTVTSAWTLTQPTISSVTLSDANFNGSVDTATLVFSAPIRDANVTDGDALLGGATHTGTFATGTANDNTTVFSLTSDNLPANTSASAGPFTYSGNTTKITDLFGNMLATATQGTIAATDYTAVDNAPPVIVATTPASGATSVTPAATIIVDFSEGINFAGCTFTPSPDTTGYGTITTAGNWSVGVSGLANSRVTIANSIQQARNTAVTITIAGCTAAVGGVALHANAAVVNPWTFTTLHANSAGGGGGSVVTPPSVNLNIPNGGETYAAGAQIGISWSAANGAYVAFRVSYSSDNGNTWNVLTSTVSGSNSDYTWTVPTDSTTQGLIKVEGLNSTGVVLASDTSATTFSVAGTTVAPPAVAPPAVTPPTTTPPPQNDDTVTGVYDSNTARQNNPTFNTDMNIPVAASPACESGSLIKGSLSAVYYCGADGKRYVFVNDKAYFSWYPDFSTVKTISDTTLASIMIGGNITYRPGSRMLKIMSDPKTYVVARGGVLRWVETEAAAVRLFGANWNQMIDDVSDSFFVNYTVGAPITQ
jgi:Bacterial Ig-like domain